MSDFKMIKKAFPNLQVWRKPYKDDQFVVTAEELEACLQYAQVVKRKKGTTPWTEDFTFFNYVPDEQAFLLCVEPLKKQTKAEAALELLERLAKDPAYYSGLGTSEARAILEMKDEV